MTWSLVSVCLLLAMLLLQAYQGGSQIDEIKDSQQRKTIKPLAVTQVQVVLADISHYSAIKNYPLFNSNRIPYREKKEVIISKPIPIPAVIPQPMIVTPDLPQLIGVMTVNNVEMAFVMATEDVEPVGLKVGDQHQKWALIAIEPTQITMSYNEVQKTIGLDWTLKEMLEGEIDDMEKRSLMQTQAEQVSNVRTQQRNVSGGLKARLEKQLQLVR